MSVSKAEEIVLRFLQKNGSIEGITDLSESAINVAVEDLINKGFVIGSQNEQREYVKGFVVLENRGKLWLEEHPR